MDPVMMNARGFAVACALAATLTACSSPNEPTKENFAKAISSELKTQCLSISLPKFDSADHAAGSPEYSFSWLYNPSLEEVKALASAGIVEPSSAVAAATRKIDGPSVVRLTAEGMRDVRLSASRHVLCLGDVELKDVVSWTIPGDSRGSQVTNVTVDIAPVSVRPWVKDQALRAQFPEVALADAPSVRRTLRLVLTNAGWKYNAPPMSPQ